MTIDALATVEELEQRVSVCAEHQPDVRGASILGSRASASTPSDAAASQDSRGYAAGWPAAT